MLSSTLWVCVIVLLSAVHTSCLQGVRWVSLLMSFPKGTVSNTRILGGMPKSLLNRLQHREARRNIWGEGGGAVSSSCQSQPPKLPLWSALQAGAGWAHGVMQENCLHPWLLILTFLTISNLMPSERLYWHTLLILPVQMPWWCVKGHTLKCHKLGKGKPKSVNKQEIWWSRRLLNTDSCLISIRFLKGNACLPKNMGVGIYPTSLPLNGKEKQQMSFLFKQNRNNICRRALGCLCAC